MRFVDRSDAGRRLAARLSELPRDQLVVLGLPRGGVVVAYEVATALGAALDVILVRKLGAPFQPELAMGAIGEDGVRVVDELARRARQFRGGRERVPLVGCTALIVDDGIATGSTARAACAVARAHGAARIVVAAPIASPGSVGRLHRDADEVIVLDHPAAFRAIGEFYDDFSQTTDEEVMEIVDRGR